MNITWFGHSAFRVEIGDNTLLIDPFLTGNPAFNSDFRAATAGTTHVLLTHGHDDHIGDTLDIIRKTGAQLVANVEICSFLQGQGVKNTNPGNTGGTVKCGDFTVSFTPALHSSSTTHDGTPVFLGSPHGLIVKRAGSPTLYHMGDTDLFSDLALVAEIHEPEIVLIPIGDRFTMGARSAALALNLYLRPKWAIPMHYGSFKVLEPNADLFKAQMRGSSVKVIVPRSGEPLDFEGLSSPFVSVPARIFPC